MFKFKNWHTPEVKDICPNCGETCAITDVLCPNCNKNLDELFEQLPVSAFSTFVIPKWMNISMNEKINRIWRMLNSLILMITFISPWKLVYSDILPSEPFPLTGLRVFLISIPHGLSNIIFLDCFSCVAGGLIAIGYMSLMLYTILNTVRVVSKAADHNLGLRKILFSCAIVSSLFFLQIITPMMLTGLAWGYWFACAVSLSCLWLEFTEWISSKSFVGRLSSKVA